MPNGFGTGGQEKVWGPLHQAQRSHVRRRQGVQAGRRRSHRRRPARARIGSPRPTRVAGAGVLRRLEPNAGAPRFKGGRHVWSTNDAMPRRTRARRTAVTRAHHPRSQRTPDGRQHHLSFICGVKRSRGNGALCDRRQANARAPAVRRPLRRRFVAWRHERSADAFGTAPGLSLGLSFGRSSAPCRRRRPRPPSSRAGSAPRRSASRVRRRR